MKKMKWGKKTRAEDEKKTKKSSSSSSFHLSNLFPLSWFSLLKRQKHDRTNPKQSPPASSAHLCFSNQLIHHTNTGEAPRRRSTGEEDRRRDKADFSRSSRHYSLSEFDLELRPISSFLQCDDSPPPPTPMKRTAVRRRRQRIRPKVKVCSPKVGRRRLEEEERKQRRNLESFAVMKNSSDPQRDFRDSMLEMIREKGMRRPEEMERLLACYINLNADEHHDAIFRAFRQVWFEFDAWRFAGECQCCHYCDSSSSLFEEGR